jgi:hypothetical protein
MKILFIKSLKAFRSKSNLFWSLCLFGLLFSSCKSVPIASIDKERNFGDYLYSLQNTNGHKYVSCEQIEVTVKEEETRTFKAKISVHKGEFIFANFNFLGIEIGRLEITPDSVKYINRLEKTYYFDNITGLSSILKFELDYYEIESLILYGYILNRNENRRKVGMHIQETSDSFIYEFMSPQYLSIKSFFSKEPLIENKIEITSKNNEFFAKALINKSGSADHFPGEIQINLKRKDYNADVFLSIGKITYDKVDPKAFNVNSKYREISF